MVGIQYCRLDAPPVTQTIGEQRIVLYSAQSSTNPGHDVVQYANFTACEQLYDLGLCLKLPISTLGALLDSFSLYVGSAGSRPARFSGISFVMIHLVWQQYPCQLCPGDIEVLLFGIKSKAIFGAL